MGFYFYMPRKNTGRESPLLLSAKYNTDEKNKERKNEKTKYNKLYTKLKYFLLAAPRRAPKQLMELKSEVDIPEKKRKQSKPMYASNICAFLTQVVLPALQGWLLQGWFGRGDVHMAPVIAG